MSVHETRDSSPAYLRCFSWHNGRFMVVLMSWATQVNHIVRILLDFTILSGFSQPFKNSRILAVPALQILRTLVAILVLRRGFGISQPFHLLDFGRAGSRFSPCRFLILASSWIFNAKRLPQPSMIQDLHIFLPSARRILLKF